MRNFTVTSIIEETRLTNSPKKNAKGFPIIRVLLCIIVLSAAAVLLAYFELRPVDAGDSEAVSFVVEKGQSVASIVKALAEQKLVRSEKLTYYALSADGKKKYLIASYPYTLEEHLLTAGNQHAIVGGYSFYFNEMLFVKTNKTKF